MSKFYQNLALLFTVPFGLICPAIILIMSILDESAVTILNSFRPFVFRLIFTFGLLGIVGSYYKFKHRNLIYSLEKNNNWPLTTNFVLSIILSFLSVVYVSGFISFLFSKSFIDLLDYGFIVMIFGLGIFIFIITLLISSFIGDMLHKYV